MEEDESRFAILEGPIDDFIDERENKKHKSKDRDAIYKLNEFDLAVFIIKFSLAPEWFPSFEMRRSVRKNLSMYKIKALYLRKC